MATWTSTFTGTPAEAEDHGRGGQRIRETRSEVLARLQPEHDAGNATTGTGYADSARHSQGSARAFYGDSIPTQLLRPDSGGAAQGPTGFSAALDAAADRGRLWVDESGGAPVLRYLTSQTSPLQFASAYGYNNHLMNGGFQVWQRNPNTTISCVAGANTYTVDRWYVNPTGATCTVSRETAGGGFAAPIRATSYFQLDGVALLTQFVLGTRIESAKVHRLKVNGDVNFSIRVRNAATGVTLTPTLRVSTATAVDNFAGVVVETTVVLPDVLNNTEAYLSTTFDTSAYTLVGGIDPGIQIELTFVGSAAIAAGQVYCGEAILEWGRSRSAYVEPPFHLELWECQRYYEKTFNYAVTPATNAGHGGALVTDYNGFDPTVQDAFAARWRFKAEKLRTNYSLAYFCPEAATTQWWAYQTNVADVGSTNGTHLVGGLGSEDSRGTSSVTITNTGSISQAGTHGIHATCEADLV